MRACRHRGDRAWLRRHYGPDPADAAAGLGALTVVTSSLPIAPASPARPGLQVLAAGGRPRSRTLAAAGGRAGNARAGAAVPGAGDFARSGERDEPGTLRAGAGDGAGLVPEPGSGGLRAAQA